MPAPEKSPHTCEKWLPDFVAALLKDTGPACYSPVNFVRRRNESVFLCIISVSSFMLLQFQKLRGALRSTGVLAILERSVRKCAMSRQKYILLMFPAFVPYLWRTHSECVAPALFMINLLQVLLQGCAIVPLLTDALPALCCTISEIHRELNSPALRSG